MMNTIAERFFYNFCPEFVYTFLMRLKASEIGSRLAKGFLWSAAGAFVSRAMMLAAFVFVARILGKSGFGELGIIQSTISMFGIFAGFGLGLTATKYVAEFRNSDPARAGRIISLSLLSAGFTGGLLAVVLFIFAPWLSEHTINAPHLTGVLRISAVILFFNAVNGAQTGALSGFEAFRTIAYVNFFVGFISFPLLLAGAYSAGLAGTVWALSVNLGINWFMNHIALRKEAKKNNVPLSIINSVQELSILWKFSLPAVLSSSLVGPVNWLCNALLVNQADGYDEMAIFNAANQWRVAVLFIPGLLGQVLLPLLSSLNNKSSQTKYNKVLRANIILNGGIAIMIVLPLVLLAGTIMKSYGSGFERGVIVFRLLSLTTILMAVNSVAGNAITSRGKVWFGFMFNILWAVLFMGITYFLLKEGFGAAGLAIASLIAYIFHTIWQGTYLFITLKEKDLLSNPALETL